MKAVTATGGDRQQNATIREDRSDQAEAQGTQPHRCTQADDSHGTGALQRLKRVPGQRSAAQGLVRQGRPLRKSRTVHERDASLPPVRVSLYLQRLHWVARRLLMLAVDEHCLQFERRLVLFLISAPPDSHKCSSTSRSNSANRASHHHVGHTELG